MNRDLTLLPWPDIAALDKHAGVVILPIGAVEQHGPHLPVITDTLLVTHVLAAALAVLPEDVKAWHLPALPYGKSTEHMHFPGTITLGTETLQAVLRDIGRSVQRAGFRRLAFINGHGGNVALLDGSARDLRAEFGLMTFCLHPALYVEAPFEQSPQEKRFGIHAGEIETALMLAAAPTLVHMDRASAHFPNFPAAAPPPLGLFGPASASWMTEDWSASGVFGDATCASVEKGEAVRAAAARRIAALIAAISTFEVGA
jgi:creatinine amidohydrolase/Fe(II)-dependent formamide hydrolase-like protein